MTAPNQTITVEAQPSNGALVTIETATHVMSFALSEAQRNWLVFKLMNPTRGNDN